MGAAEVFGLVKVGPGEFEVQSLGPCECADEPVPGAWVGMNDRDEVQRCDDCEEFACDEDAADAVAALVGGVRVDRSDPPDDFWWVVQRGGRTLTAADIDALAGR